MTKDGETPVTPDQFNNSGLLFAPVNQVANAWGMLGPKFSAVQSGNSDTQYSVTWFDSSEEPYVLHIPKSHGRYYTFQFIDAYTNNFHYASTRTMGSQDQDYALVAPAADDGLLGLLKNMGISVDHGFDTSGLSDGEKKALVQAISDGNAMLAAKSASMGKEVNGWQLSPVLNEYFGTDYLFRAAIGYQAMFVNTPIEAYYPGVFKDLDGNTLDGSAND